MIAGRHYRSNDNSDTNMRALKESAPLHVIEDVCFEEERRQATTVVRPIPVRSIQSIQRPVAVKVVRPIPKRVTEQFYNEAHEGGLTLKETSEATALAHDWHRKWTQQDELNHTMPDTDFYASNILEQSHIEVDINRQGATNPLLLSHCSSSLLAQEIGKRALHDDVESPQDHHFNADLFLFNPEDRLSPSSYSDASSLSSYVGPQIKRRFLGSSVEDTNQFPALTPVRPVALHPSAIRPQVIRPLQPVAYGRLPQDITTMGRYERISPMSCSQGSMHSRGHETTPMIPQQTEVHVVEDYERSSIMGPSRTEQARIDSINAAKDDLLQALAVTQGDVDSPKFKKTLDPLLKFFDSENVDTRPHLKKDHESINGMWLSLSKPSFFGCLGENEAGDPLYTLGRMSFDMFSPTNLVCSLQGNFNPVEVVDEEERNLILATVPKSLRDEVESGKTVLRTYHVITAFTIEPTSESFANAPNKDVHRPIRGIMTTFGYSLPDPDVTNRHSIWFTGGRIEPNNSAIDIFEWKRLFSLHPPHHSLGEKAKLLAVKLLMGATVPESLHEDGSMRYTFTRPIGGHGTAFVDVIFLDESLRIVRGQRGTIFVFSRIIEHDNQH